EAYLHAHAPDFKAQRLAAFLGEVIPPRSTPSVVMSRAEFTDENSVIFRLKDIAPPAPPAPALKRPPVAANRLTAPSLPIPTGAPPRSAPQPPPLPKGAPLRSAPRQAEPDEVPQPPPSLDKTIVNPPPIIDEGTIELSDRMLIPVEDKTEDTTIR